MDPRVAIVTLGVLTVIYVNFVPQLGYANELSGSNIGESQLVQIKVYEDRGLFDKDDRGQDYEMMQNQTTCSNPNPAQKTLDKKDKGRQDDEMMQCEDRGLFDKDEGRQNEEMMLNQVTRPNPNPAQTALDKNDEGRQDDEIMQNQATRAHPNPAEMAGIVYKVKEKLPGCQNQSQTGQNQSGKSQTQTLTQTQTQTHNQTAEGKTGDGGHNQTAEGKTGDGDFFDKKDEVRQDHELTGCQIGCQIQSQTGQTQIGKAQTQSQTQTQTQTLILTVTIQLSQTGTQTVQCKTGDCS